MNGQDFYGFIRSLPAGKVWMIWDAMNNGSEHELYDGDVARAVMMIEHSDSEKRTEWLYRITWELSLAEVSACK